jgi:hypothetical protein
MAPKGNPSALNEIPLFEDRAVNGDPLFEANLRGHSRTKYKLILVTRIRPLLDLDHIQLFQDFEAVAAGYQQDYVARLKDSTPLILLIG